MKKHHLFSGLLILAALTGPAEAQSPIARAGVDQHVKVQSHVQLDASNSQGSPSLGATPLIYEWQLISQPVGSKATLDDAASATPSFVPDLRGTYVAEATVLQGSLTSLPATVTITAAPDVAAHPVATRVVKNNGSQPSDYCVSLDGNFYCASGVSLTGVFVAVLERSTLDVVDTKTFDGTTSYAAATNYLNSLRSNEIMVLSTLQHSGGINALANALEAFGTTHAVEGLGADANLSVIGIKGLETGQAWEVGPGSVPGLTGDFVLDSNSNYTFVQFDYVTYQLAPSATGQASITVGNQPPILSTPGSPGGFLVVVIDRATLSTTQPLANRTFNTSGAAPVSEQDAMAALLATYQGNPAVLILAASFGDPNQAVSPQDSTGIIHFNELAQRVNSAGGTYETFSYLGRVSQADTYSALLGGIGESSESSSIRTPQMPQGILRGALGRGHQGNWYQVVSTSLTQSADLDIYNFIGQAPQGWPHPNTAGEQAAFTWIGQQLCGDCTDLRYAYSDTNISLASWELQLTSLAYPDGQNFTSTDFSNVKNQLLTEFRYADEIQKFQANIASLWTDQQANFSLISTAVADKVKSAITPPPESPFVKYLQEAISSAIQIAEAFASDGIINVVNEVVTLKDPHGVLQAFLNFGTQIAKDNLGNAAEQTPSIDSTVAGLDQRAAYTFAQQLVALGTSFNVITEDWGKMSSLGKKLSNPQNKQWAWNGSVTTGTLLQNLTVALEAGLYRSLMQDVFKVREWHAYAGAADPGNFNDGGQYLPKHSWENWPTTAWIASNDTFLDPNYPYQNPVPDQDIIWLDRSGFNKQTVPAMLQHLYARITDGGLAVYKPDVFRNWGLTKFYCNSADYSCDETSDSSGLGTSEPAAGALSVTSVFPSQGTITLGQRTALKVFVQAGTAAAQGVTIDYYDGDPHQGGTLFGSQQIPYIAANTSQLFSNLYSPGSCGNHAIFVVASTPLTAPSTGTTAVQVSCDNP